MVEPGIIIEPLIEPIEERIAFIKDHKAKVEIETRLRLMRPVVGQLPAAYLQAWAAYKSAGAAYGGTRAATEVEIEALHRHECPDCPWDGRSIFPKDLR